MKLRLLFTLSLAFLMGVSAFSQSFYQWKRDRRFTVSAGIGGASYYGDLNDPQDIIDFTTHTTLGFEYKLHPRYDARLDLSYLRVSGDDDLRNDNEYQRNLSFRSDVIEVNGMGIVNLFGDEGAYFERPGVNAHAMLGVGLAFFNPKTEYQGDFIALRPLQTEGVAYSRIAFVIPFGLGVNFAVSKEFSVGIEGIYRKTFTDYLDDVSTSYPDPSSFTDPIAADLSDRRTGGPITYPGTRGNPNDKDGYATLTLRVEYYLPDYIFKKTGGRSKFKPRKSRNSRSPRFRRAKSGTIPKP